MKSNNKIRKGCSKSLVRKAVLILVMTFISCMPTYAQTYTIPDPNFKNFLYTLYPTCFNGNGDLVTSCASMLQGTMDCSNKNIKNLSGIEYFTSIPRIICRNNQITYIPSLAGNINLIELDCSQNFLTFLPDLSNADSLRTLICSNNQIPDLPDLNVFPGLDTLSVDNNNLTFADLLKINKANFISFTYAPQAPVQVPAQVQVQESGQYLLKFPNDTSAAFTYKLFKNNILFQNLDSLDSFLLTNIQTSDLGFYTWQVSQSSLPGLTLQTSPQELVILNKNSQVFTPNGDNLNDYYTITCEGTKGIYNRFGILLKEFTGTTAYWDGTDLQGKPVPTGIYLIKCGEKVESSVTLVR